MIQSERFCRFLLEAAAWQKLVIVLSFLMSGGLWAESRPAAFAVGIDQYDNATDLENGVSATNRFAEVLEEAGFIVSKQTDSDKQTIQSGFSNFLGSSQSSELRIFYFSGHGIETGGQNYLLPSNASAANEGEVKATCISLGDWLKEMSKSRAGTDILILDCCRNNPFSQGNGGMASVSDLPDHTVILFAAQPGKVAYDRPLGGEREGEPVSPFTLALIEAFSTDHDNLISLFSSVTDTVQSDTYRQQEPYLKLSGSLTSLNRFRIHVPSQLGDRPSGPWMFPHSRHSVLTHEELSELGAEELWRARNEIFARHGYRFTTPKGREFAATLDPKFYQPLKQDVQDKEMTQAERTNIDLIKRYEDAARGGTGLPSVPSSQSSIWLFPDSSTTRLSAAQLAGLDSGTLWRARNEIFARKGLIFQSARGKALCRKLGSAYQPITSDQSTIFSRLTAVEEANVELIARFELGVGGNSDGGETQNTTSAGGVWLFPDSGSRLLSDNELSGLSATQLKWARNEIYARHGYIFSSDFGRQIARQLGSAYLPRSSDMKEIEALMNQFEKSNIAKILRHEK